MGYGLVGASTQVLVLLEWAAPSLYEEFTIPYGPWHEVLYPVALVGQMAGLST